jgi:predicted secreted protein
MLQRAVDASLLHKIATGHYFINPFLYMSKSAAGESNYQQQELIQARWRETTGLLSAQDIEQLHALSKYLDQPVILPGTEFNLSVAYYYSKHNTITAKQIAAYKKRAIITANWSPNGSIYNQP